MHRAILPLIALGLGLLAACAPQSAAVPPTPEPVELYAVVDDPCESLARALLDAYTDGRPWVSVRVDVYDSAIVERMVRQGGVDLAILAWPEAEGPALDTALWNAIFAYDGLAITVNPSSPLEGLTLLELQEIYRGRIGDWEGMGPIQTVSREEGSGTRAAFEALVMGQAQVTLTAVVMPSSRAVLEYVAQHPDAIGYASMARLTPAVRALALEGVLPSPASVQDGSYPLRYPLYLATLGEPAGPARDFVQWVLEPDGQRIVAQYAMPVR